MGIRGFPCTIQENPWRPQDIMDIYHRKRDHWLYWNIMDMRLLHKTKHIMVCETKSMVGSISLVVLKCRGDAFIA